MKNTFALGILILASGFYINAFAQKKKYSRFQERNIAVALKKNFQSAKMMSILLF